MARSASNPTNHDLADRISSAKAIYLDLQVQYFQYGSHLKSLLKQKTLLEELCVDAPTIQAIYLAAASAPRTSARDVKPMANLPPLLQVPYALDPAGELVTAEDAVKKVRYTCPGCGDVLILRAGTLKVRHFAHPSDTTCTGMSIEHKTAQLLVAAAIKRQADPDCAEQIKIQFACSCCEQPVMQQMNKGALTEAVLEFSIGSTYRVDVMAGRAGQSLLAIEVLFTHAVSEEKARGLDYPWIELRAVDLIANPLVWIPVASKLNMPICQTCKERSAHLATIADAAGLPAPLDACSRRYVEGACYAIAIDCWRCKEEILVYRWQHEYQYGTLAPTAPAPKTLQLRYVKAYKRSCLVNTCPHCGTHIQDLYSAEFPGKFTADGRRELPFLAWTGKT